ncbi:hypothetical protein ElyMa_004283500 [Elysia marginata]|uniref:Uncharacterized protein n=1 Tax=Elysia marginata TaxID=1093978 RepID=A0AAV4GUN8_9GAST|nr:hypothetical protein ElyMa_004283500 [Elysia marginata]
MMSFGLQHCFTGPSASSMTRLSDTIMICQRWMETGKESELTGEGSATEWAGDAGGLSPLMSGCHLSLVSKSRPDDALKDVALD